MSNSFLLDATTVYADGTFYVAPKLFTQLYTIHAYVANKTMICCAYFLLPGKTQEIYMRVKYNSQKLVQ